MSESPRHPLVRDFLNLRRMDWSPQHIANGVNHLNRFTEYCDRIGVELVDASSRTCADFLTLRDRRRDRAIDPAISKVGVAALTKDHQFLKGLFAWLDDDGALPKGARNPMRGMAGVGQPPVDYKRIPHIVEADYVKLMSSFDKRLTLDCRNAAICSLMYHSGIRRSQVVAIDLDRLDLGAGIVEVFNPKNDRWWQVPLATETCQLIERYLRRRGDDRYPVLFLGTAGTKSIDGRLAPRAISDMLTRKGDKLGLSLPPHAFRRAMTINANSNDISTTTIQQVGQWTDGRMVSRYQRGAAAELALAEFRAKDRTGRRTAPPKRRLRVA